jgi:hypothetical protein
MGWASGSSLLCDVIGIIEERAVFPNSDWKVTAYVELMEAFADRDCDTFDECLGISAAFDEAYKEYYGGDESDDDNEDD